MEVNIVKIGKTEYIMLPKGWKDLVEKKMEKRIKEGKVAMEVNTILRIFPIATDGKIIEG